MLGKEVSEKVILKQRPAGGQGAGGEHTGGGGGGGRTQAESATSAKALSQLIRCKNGEECLPPRLP